MCSSDLLIDQGVISGGMIPKIRAALAALTYPGSEAIIADSAVEHALDRALGDAAFGTRIRAGASSGAGAA